MHPCSTTLFVEVHYFIICFVRCIWKHLITCSDFCTKMQKKSMLLSRNIFLYSRRKKCFCLIKNKQTKKVFSYFRIWPWFTLPVFYSVFMKYNLTFIFKRFVIIFFLRLTLFSSFLYTYTYMYVFTVQFKLPCFPTLCGKYKVSSGSQCHSLGS